MMQLENLYMMRRLVNATKSVNFSKYDQEYKEHKKFVKNLERMGDPRGQDTYGHAVKRDKAGGAVNMHTTSMRFDLNASFG